MPLPATLSDTTEADLQRLIADREAEGPHLEFKREPPRGDQAGRHELAADVSAMGNSGGGDVVFGIDEDAEGLAGAIVPFVGNADQEALRLLEVLGSSIEPRLPGLQVHAVPVDGGSVFIARVPQSWAGPHRVKTNQHFFIREGARKRQLDIPEIRGLFLRTESQAQKVRDFRTDRLGALLSGNGPVRLHPGSIQVLHLIPTQATLGLMSVDPVPYMNRQVLPVLGSTGIEQRINVDGALGVRNMTDRGTHGYSQFFRNGYFEAVRVDAWAGDAQRTALGCILFEQHCIQIVHAFRRELVQLGYSTEMTAMWSLLHADKSELGLDRWRFHHGDNLGRFDRPTIVIPDVLLRAEDDTQVALRPLFDLIWQAGGMQRSFNYDEQGNWAPPRNA
jgi:hypothetical protein